MFKVFINDGLNEAPTDDIFYIVGKEGLFIKKSLGIIDSITPIDNISVLNSVETCARINIEKIPQKMFVEMYMFFKDVYKKFQSEAILLIFYNEKTHEYKLVSPKQEVSGASMDYDRKVTIKNYTMIGDIHSHGTMSAFHSSVDDNDEESFDGLHITLGHITSSNFSISSSIVINGSRFIVDPFDYIAGIQKAKDIELESLMYKSMELVTLYKFNKESDIDEKYFKSKTYETNNKYNFLPGVLEKVEGNTEWIKQVTKKVYKRKHYLENQDIINNEWYNHNFINYNTKFYTNNYEPIENIDDTNDINDINESPCLSCKYRNTNISANNNILKNKTQIYKCHKCGCIIREYKRCPNCLTIKHLEIQTEDDQYNKYMEPLNYIKCEICGNKYLLEDYKDGCPFCYQQRFINF